MKTLLKLSFAGLLSFLLLTSLSLREHPEDPPRGEKKKKITKVVVQTDGERTVVDTLVNSEEEVAFDFDFDFEIDSTLKEEMKKIKVMLADESGKHSMIVHALDSCKPLLENLDIRICKKPMAGTDSIMEMIVIKDLDGEKAEKVIRIPHPFVSVPEPPYPPMPCLKFGKHPDDVMILGFGGGDIISYKKKDLSGGREKIEIIRKKQPEIEKEIKILKKDEN